MLTSFWHMLTSLRHEMTWYEISAMPTRAVHALALANVFLFQPPKDIYKQATKIAFRLQCNRLEYHNKLALLVLQPM